jgi:hypothetical protein
MPAECLCPEGARGMRLIWAHEYRQCWGTEDHMACMGMQNVVGLAELFIRAASLLFSLIRRSCEIEGLKALPEGHNEPT